MSGEEKSKKTRAIDKLEASIDMRRILLTFPLLQIATKIFFEKFVIRLRVWVFIDMKFCMMSVEWEVLGGYLLVFYQNLRAI